MGMGPQGGGSRRGGRRGRGLNSEINVTPLVDVMLVLLIVFMVTAPLLTVSVPVDLPKTSAKTSREDKEPLVVTIDKTGQIFLQETRMEAETLVTRLQAITGNDPEARIFVRGDRDLSYGRIMGVMGLVTTAGYTKVALVAELPTGAGR
jgi:biopolymer transport protein TolR